MVLRSITVAASSAEITLNMGNMAISAVNSMLIFSS